METKKTWEKHLQLIPVIRPSHCLSIEISNSASPRRWVLYIMYAADLLACKHTGIIHPARTLCCEIFWWIKFAKFDIVEDNVQKRPFMLLTRRGSRPRLWQRKHIPISFWPARPVGTGLVKHKVRNYFPFERIKVKFFHNIGIPKQ